MTIQKITNGATNGSMTSLDRPTILLDSPKLSKSQYLDGLKVLLDDVFTWAHTKAVPGKEFLPATVGRLESGPQQLVSELGPDGFCIIMFEGKVGGKIIATASAKPYKPTKEGTSYGSDTNMLFKRPPGAKETMDAEVVGSDVENQSRWELLAFATDIELMGKGIAGQLAEMTNVEVRKRAASEGKTKVVLMLSTMKDLNEPYYLKRGFRTYEREIFPAWSSRESRWLLGRGDG